MIFDIKWSKDDITSSFRKIFDSKNSDGDL